MLKKELKKWYMNYKEHQNISCESPCSMYSVLLENNLIEDPFYGMNEQEATKLSNFPCEFHSVFTVSEEEYAHEYIELEFLGLDTLCDIYLNGKLVDKTTNMHLAYNYNVKDYIIPGENTLKLYFSSPVEYFKNMDKKHYVWVNGDTIPGAAHLRKGLSMSGWDWGPKLPDMGIFRPVSLKCYDYGKIEDFFIYQNHSENKVKLDIEVNISGICDEAYIYIDNRKILLEGGKAQIEIDNPKLWWPKGYGEQNLYEIKFELIKNGKITDELTKRIGLRTLTVSQEEDADGKEFCFIVNGVKIFAMGANYVPQDNLLSRINPENTRKLLDSCVDANFNSIRIWGGGYYPEDYFYDICDEYGLIVWQDFMFACCNVWLSKNFKELIKKEIIYNVKRLRHHPSLGLLCGNNEMEDGVLNWGISNALVKTDYLELYEHIMPDLCEELAPQTFYWPSSPSCGGGLENPNKESEGDVHYWAVWHGSKPFTDYRNYRFRFCSEYGFESFPNIKTIKSFCEEKDMNPFSEVMENHQKCKGGNTKILTYLAGTYLYPTSFENLVYASQVIQADAIKYGVEYFRKIRGCCMGSIYWQFNDCWPVASWSSVDYFGRYKALHYAAKKFYAPVMTALFDEKDKITVTVANETMNKVSGYIKYGVYKNDFTELLSGKRDYEVEQLKSKDIFEVDISEFNGRNDVFFTADTYDEDGNFIMRQTHIFKLPKHFEWKKPEFKSDIKCDGENIFISVSADCFAKSVEIDFEDYDLTLSDNYFDITGKEAVIVSAKSDIDINDLKKSIKIKSVYDIR